MQDNQVSRDLRWKLHWARWGLWALAALAAAVASARPLGWAHALLAALVIGYLGLLYLALELRWPPGPIDRLALALDSVLVAVAIHLMGGPAAPASLLGLFPIVEASIAFAWPAVAGTTAFLALSYAAMGFVPSGPSSIAVGLPQAAISAGAIALLGACLSFIGNTRSSWTAREGPRAADPPDRARERARALSRIASTLSDTLNYERVLDSILDLGVEAFRDLGDQRPRGLILLFSDAGALKVAACRNLAEAEASETLPGRAGLVAQALSSAEPSTAPTPSADPELGRFRSLESCRSAVALPLRAGFRAYGALVFASERELPLPDEQLEFLAALASQTILALQNSQLYQELQAERNHLIVEEDGLRRQLARDLHDGPAQGISAVAMRLAYVRALLERDPAAARAQLQSAERLAYDTSREIRAALFKLRPIILESEGLVAALGQYLDRLRELGASSFWLEDGGFSERMNPHIEAIAFAIVEEAVGNARKHSAASNIWVRLRRLSDCLAITVRDDGEGFDLEAVRSSYDQRASLGLLNMQERAELIEATLTIDSKPGDGTAVTLAIPLQSEPG